MKNDDIMKTLEELEKNNWGRAQHDSYVIRRSHELRKIPLNDLGIEDIRLLASQQIGLTYIVPLALDILDSNPFAEGDSYEGDLLGTLAAIPNEFWVTNDELRARLFSLEIKIKDFYDGPGRALNDKVGSLRK